MIFVDTNYFLRFLLNDNEKQYIFAKELFIDAAQRKVKLTTSLIVFFEVVWVLRSSYGKNKEALVETLFNMLKLDFEIPEKYQITESLSLFERTSLSLEDCYNLVFAKYQNCPEFKTFDIKLEKEFSKVFGSKKS